MSASPGRPRPREQGTRGRTALVGMGGPCDPVRTARGGRETTGNGMTARVALVTTDLTSHTYGDDDAAPLSAALEAAGVTVAEPRWRDAGVEWAGFDLVVLRSPWDYMEHPEAFETWMDATSQVTRVLNPPPLIRWDLDKRYMADLARLGAPPAPTDFCEDATRVAVALGSRGGAQVVVKPNISAGSRLTGLFRADDPAARELAAAILAEGKLVMVQDAIATIAQGAEHGLVYLDGTYSHAFAKGPILDVGGQMRGGTYTEVITPVTPSDDEIAFGHRALAAIASIARERAWGPDAVTPLYARIDVATDTDATVRLVEAELFEPSLYFRVADEGAPVRMARAILERLHT